jgi:hypothetical protein
LPLEFKAGLVSVFTPPTLLNTTPFARMATNIQLIRELRRPSRCLEMTILCCSSIPRDCIKDHAKWIYKTYSTGESDQSAAVPPNTSRSGHEALVRRAFLWLKQNGILSISEDGKERYQLTEQGTLLWRYFFSTK